MSVLFTDCMTVYNYYEDPETGEERWNRSVIHGIQWRHGKKSTSIQNGAVTESIVESITVDCVGDYGNPQYVPPEEYGRIADDGERAGKWTLNARDHKDIVVLGVCEEEIGGNLRMKDILNGGLCAGIVKSTSDNRRRPMLQHIRLEAVRS
ncbi:MAG: hypothetical protein NC399_06420 [Muribaculum sp.]|nr:hypothetical protein [Muribaculum sp.]